MAKRAIRVGLRLNYERLDAMYHACSGMAEDFIPSEEHEYLLLTHLMALERKMEQMLERNQAMYTLNLSAPEALAFKQVWQICGRYQDRYTQVVVGALVKKVNEMNADNIAAPAKKVIK
ncbi:MAG: hypothetical protein BGO69_00865 [Bacteroidetes bacterium 46-16]|nr:MAG: hypothetical protein BGO69_00865 [Bacteroidetes bacterium 46-16]